MCAKAYGSSAHIMATASSLPLAKNRPWWAHLTHRTDPRESAVNRKQRWEGSSEGERERGSESESESESESGSSPVCSDIVQSNLLFASSSATFGSMMGNVDQILTFRSVFLFLSQLLLLYLAPFCSLPGS